jgi:hypothetical protein
MTLRFTPPVLITYGGGGYAAYCLQPDELSAPAHAAALVGQRAARRLVWIGYCPGLSGGADSVTSSSVAFVSVPFCTRRLRSLTIRPMWTA